LRAAAKYFAAARGLYWQERTMMERRPPSRRLSLIVAVPRFTRCLVAALCCLSLAGCRPTVISRTSATKTIDQETSAAPRIFWRCLNAAGNPEVIELGGEQVEVPAGGPDVGQPTIDAYGLRSDYLEELSSGGFDPQTSAWELSVFVDDPSEPRQSPAYSLLGSYEAHGAALRFVPRFPLAAGMSYRVAFAPADGNEYAAYFRLPKAETTSTTVVSQVYPSGDELPENQLKFYLHFSAPMSRGYVYRHARLLKADGGVVEYAFLEIAEELWDRSGTRLTLLLDPGRVKRGLKPREEEGPIFEEGKEYTLVIDRQWPDAAGNPMVEEFRKPIRIGPPDDVQPDAKTWKVSSPRAGSHDPLHVELNEPLDHAMLAHVIWVEDSSGEPVAGQVAIDRNETRWQLVPEAAWKAGDYRLAVENTLEDRAGNSLRRKFEVDVFDEVQTQTKAAIIRLPFAVTADGT
jgi:hypothetical protein